MKNIQNLPEKVFFIIINLLFASGPLVADLIGKLSLLISHYFFHVNPANSENDWQFLYGCIILYLIYILIKFTLFPILYMFKKQLPFIHNFFDKFLKERNFKYKVFVGSMLIDVLILCIHILQLKVFFNYTTFSSLLDSTIFLYELFGFGLFGTYLAFLIWLKFLGFLNRKK